MFKINRSNGNFELAKLADGNCVNLKNPLGFFYNEQQLGDWLLQRFSTTPHIHSQFTDCRLNDDHPLINKNDTYTRYVICTWQESEKVTSYNMVSDCIWSSKTRLSEWQDNINISIPSLMMDLFTHFTFFS